MEKINNLPRKQYPLAIGARRAKDIFDPEMMGQVDFKMNKEQVDTAENFASSKVLGHQMDFNFDDKLVKVDFTVSVKTDDKDKNEG